jgi:hypothetical protein
MEGDLSLSRHVINHLNPRKALANLGSQEALGGVRTRRLPRFAFLFGSIEEITLFSVKAINFLRRPEHHEAFQSMVVMCR